MKLKCAWTISVFLVLILLSAPAAYSKAETIKWSKAGFAAWVPEKPVNSSINGNIAMYIVKLPGLTKSGAKGFMLTVLSVSKAQRKASDSNYLSQFIKGEQHGYRNKASSHGEKVTEKLLGPVSGEGWTGYRFQVKHEDNKLIYKQYGISDSCLYTAVAINQELNDANVKRFFSSISCSKNSQ